MDCGHYIPRKHNSTFVDEINNNGQCPTCNQVKHGNIPAYEVGLELKYGKGTVARLKRQKEITKQWTTDELEGLIQHFSKEFAKLYKEKGL